MYPDNIENILDFDKVRAKLINKTLCEEGQLIIQQQTFFTDENLLLAELKAVEELKAVLSSGDSFSTLSFVSFGDIHSTLKFEGSSLSTEQLVRLHHIIKGIFELQKFFIKKERAVLYPSIVALFDELVVQKSWYQKIDAIIDLEKIVVRSNASPELIKIRSKLSKLERQQEKAFNIALKDYQQKGWLADQKESWRADRRVLAVQSEYKRQVAGLILDLSSNARITFIEPSVVQPIAAEISEMQVNEQKEIDRILRSITADLYPYRHDFKRYNSIIAQLDAWQAKASLAFTMKAVYPELSSELSLVQARHPVLEQHLKEINRAIVPLDIHLDQKNTILVISGPNAGGKSVAMKTVGLLQLMLQFGLHIPANEGAKMKVFDAIMVDIGDDQSIEDDLSTYSSHLVKMTHFVKKATNKTLFLIDEMGSGTDPALGGPIAEAILEQLHHKKSYGIITTHYSNLKLLASTKSGIQNGSMSFEIKALKPTYSLHIGQAGASYAFEVAERSGLPKELIESAKSKVGEEKSDAEQSLSQIQNEKQYLKGIRKNNQKQSQYLEKLITNYETLKKSIERQKKKLVAEYEEKLLEDYNKVNRDLENYIRETKEKTNADRTAVKKVRLNIDQKRQKLSKKLDSYDIKPIQENKAPIIVGSEVKLEDSPRTGKVIEIRKNKALVVFGKIRSTIALDKLIHCVEEEVTPTKSTNYKKNNLTEKSQFDNNLDLRGKYKDEAMFELEQFLDRAVMFDIDQVRIIHGKGTGAIKEVVQQYLKKYPYVTKQSFEVDSAGGKGVTIAELG